jgi:hypothetical protein
MRFLADENVSRRVIERLQAGLAKIVPDQGFPEPTSPYRDVDAR